ncbi:thiamine phosphate synthase [Vreelandella utahensis]|uniref:thiamine phosphate synthase n=1 Tax=Vreelandella halophila TaxID=86177 RepID=UPI000985A4AB|nr:thiamine phosphate synthase [Halomonas utahensis]
MNERMPGHGLYAITDSQLLPDDRIVDAVEQALAGGAVMVQYRDKRPDDDLRRSIAEQLLAVCQRWGRPLIVNDDVALARQIGADGVHLGLEDATPEQAREQLGPGAIIGVTCHDDLERAREQASGTADYLAFGRFFPSATKGSAPSASADVLGQAGALGLPSVAIGGITTDNAPSLIRAGADLIAVIHGLFSAQDIEATAREFTQLFATGASS